MHSIAESGSQDERTDEHLLQDYATGRDTEAFAGIVRRHGNMVLGVCRRLLQQEQDAEDAFQATFLVLMHKARSLTSPSLLANWLYGVAYRTALKARLAAARRHQREKPIVTEPAVEPASEAAWADLRPILDDELHRLPQKYRAAVVLCYLEGQTTQEAAATLRCPKGTILSRLARARERLRRRLTRRGLALSTGVLATLLLRAASAEGCVTPMLLRASVPDRAPAPPGTPASGITANAADLGRQVLKDMRLKRVQSGAALLLAVLLGLWLALFVYRTVATPRTAGEQGPITSDTARIQGGWRVVAMTWDGVDLPKEEIAATRLTVQGETITMRGFAGALEMTFRLDPTANPRAIDLRIKNDPNPDRRGIYALSGDTMTVCWQEDPGLRRPADFVSKPNSGVALFTAKRATP
jgi:RNA polymerase sigma factor (sigma-70 family)